LGASVALTGLAVMAPELSDHGQRIGAATVQQLRRRTVRLRRLDDILGGCDTWPVYASELARTRRLVDDASYTLETGRELLGVVAEQAQQAGWAALDAGRPDTARGLFRDSMTAATDAGDSALMANALALLSYQSLLVGAPGTEEADASCRVVTREAPAAVRALLYERAAWSHAVAGPEHTLQVEYSLRQAEAALAEGNARSADPDWAAWVDEVELQIMTGRCWTALRQPKRAVPALQWALARYDDAHARDKALYLTWLAEAHMDAGDPEESARTLARAVDLAGDVASARPQRRIQTVLDLLRPHRMLQAVAEVFELAAPSPRTSSA
jgi:tetratricopeptide (TPR) repeat protein